MHSKFSGKNKLAMAALALVRGQQLTLHNDNMPVSECITGVNPAVAATAKRVWGMEKGHSSL